MKTSKLKITWKKAAAVLLAAAILAFVGCYYAPGTSGNNARAGLVLTKAVAANISSFALVVEGPGMNTIYTSFSPPQSSIKIDVPSGNSRKFTLLMNTPSATLQGTATVDLNPGEDREITLEPTLVATEIVVPDYLNRRIAQVSDIDFSGWTAKINTDFGVPDTLYPYDIDFDDQGRIYIANYDGATSAFGAVVRIDDIQHTLGFISIDPSPFTVSAVAVDRANGYVYYTSGKNLYRRRVADYAGSLTTFNLNNESALASLANPSGIAVDEQGMLYIALPSGATYGTVAKYDPERIAGSRVLADAHTVYTFSGTISPFDVLVKDDYVYASDSGNGRIVRFDKNLQFADYYSGPIADPFQKPKRFLAVLNKKITVIDDDQSSGTNRIASFGYLTGAGWMSLGVYGTGNNQFRFWEGC